MSLTAMANTDSTRSWQSEPIPALFLLQNFVTRGTKRRQDPKLIAFIYTNALRSNFDQRVSEWIHDTQWHSSIPSIVRHPQFSALVGMGQPILQFILERMAAGDQRVHWFPLLKAISKADPVPEHLRGHIGEMANQWLSWGRQNNFIRD